MVMPYAQISGGQSIIKLDALAQRQVNTAMHRDSRLIRVQQNNSNGITCRWESVESTC